MPDPASGSDPDRGDLTKAGRAQQKHGIGQVVPLIQQAAHPRIKIPKVNAPSWIESQTRLIELIAQTDMAA